MVRKPANCVDEAKYIRQTTLIFFFPTSSISTCMCLKERVKTPRGPLTVTTLDLMVTVTSFLKDDQNINFCGKNEEIVCLFFRYFLKIIQSYLLWGF